METPLTKADSKGNLLVGMRFGSPTKSDHQNTPTSTTTAYTNETDSKYVDNNSEIGSNMNILIPHDHWLDFPRSIQLSIIQHLSPSLAKYCHVSQTFNSIIKEYVSTRSKKFKELKDEASTWGHKSTHLYQILTIEPLIIEHIIRIVYDPLLNNTRTRTNTRDIEKTLPLLQKHIFKAFEVAIDDYENCWASIVPLINIIKKYRLNYIKYMPLNQFVDTATQPELPTISLDSIATNDSVTGIHEDYVDENFVKWNEALCLLSSQYGHVSNFPSYFSISSESLVELNEKALRLFIKRKSSRGVFKIMENSRVLGQFFELLLKGLKVCLKLSRKRGYPEIKRNYLEDEDEEKSTLELDLIAKKEVEVVVLLLGYVFNDNQGPYLNNDRIASNQAFSSEIVSKAVELKESMNLNFNFCNTLMRFVVMHDTDALSRKLNYCHITRNLC